MITASAKGSGQPVTIDQPEIEAHCVMGREPQVLLGIGNPHDEINGEPRSRQRVAKQEAKVGFVFDSNQAHDTNSFTSGDYKRLTTVATNHALPRLRCSRGLTRCLI